MRSELPWVQIGPYLFYAEGVIAKTFPVCNNPFGVRQLTDLDPG